MTHTLTKFLLDLQRVYALAKIHGIRIDMPYAEKKALELEQEERQLEAQLEQVVGWKVNPRSPQQVGRVLFGGEPYKMPILGYTDTGNPATGVDILNTLLETHPDHEFLTPLLRARRVSKFNGTYYQGYSNRADVHGYIHPTYQVYGTVTGRPSAKDPNTLNVPSRGKESKEVKAMMTADHADDSSWRIASNCWMEKEYDRALDWIRDDSNHILYQRDLSQAELRVVAHLSQDPALLGAYRDDTDIHAQTATEIWGADRADEMRRTAKIFNFL